MGDELDPLLAGLGRRCRRRRSDLQLLQKTVAAYLGMRPSAYSQLEKGRKLRISPQQLVRLTEILQTSADYLLGLQGARGTIPDETRGQSEEDPATTQAPRPGC